MRVNVDKYLFVGKDKTSFFISCREYGVVEFISEKQFITTENTYRFIECLKIFKQLEKKYPLESLLFPKIEELSTEEILDEVLILNREIQELSEKVKTLNKEIFRVKPLGAFSSSEISEFSQRSGLTLRFFYRKHIEGENLEVAIPNVFYLSTAYNFDYYVVVGIVELPSDVYTEIDASKSVNEFHAEVANLQREIREKSERLCKLYAYRKDIVLGLCAYSNEQNLHQAEECCEKLFDGKVFAVVGWVIADRIQELEQLCKELHVYMEKVAIDDNDVVPTHLENQGIGKMGEDLVNIYDTPASSDKDPSSWVFLSFVVFFSMIVNDAGYGLVFLAASLFLAYKNRKKLRTSAVLSRFLKMFTILGITCFCWGVATTSFFGMSFDIQSPLRQYSLTHALALKKSAYYVKEHPQAYKELVNEFPVLKSVQNPEAFLFTKESISGGSESKAIVYNKFVDSILMEFALIIGAIHLSLGMLRYSRFRYSGLGWVIFIVSAYLYIPTYLKTVSLIHYLFQVPYEFGASLGYYGMFGGIGLAVFLAMIQRSWRGIDEVVAVIQVFSDVLSYLRIYALGLAGAMMSVTFNQMGARFPMLFGSLVIILGHSVNIILSVMGGVIHGLRLNFIEWYHYSFDGGGRSLRPLKKIICYEESDT
ncbi:V-type ATP synthase subunit I [Chlamydia sp. 17-3921]|uniref:V-type ATP synthase subunit I n=1 Tax=Chlamydia sp. 17-3921 TaxID=2675798 RepID=UPI0019180A3C|nr:V-type ATP synthase subunit I [Chlamydia sp. 17-3921]